MSASVDISRTGYLRQVTASTHVQRCEALFLSGIGCDLTVVAGKDNTKLRVHRTFFIMASPVLRDMVIPPGDTGVESKPDEILMQGMARSDLATFVKFLYSGDKSAVSIGSAWRLLRAAKTYDVPELAQHCEILLGSNLTDDFVLRLYEEAALYKNQYLIQTTLDYMSKRASRILESPQFSTVALETIQTIVRLDDLAVLDKGQLYTAVVKWAHAELGRQGRLVTPMNVRSVLETVIPFIRFPAMTVADLAFKMRKEPVLSDEEALEVKRFSDTARDESETSSFWMFNSNPRQYFVPTGSSYEAFCSKGASGRWSSGCFGESNTWSLKFRVNTVRIWIRRVIFNLSFYDQPDDRQRTFIVFIPEDDLRMEIRDEAGQVLVTQRIDYSLESETLRYDAHCQLGRDLLIKKNEIYSITIIVGSLFARGRFYKSYPVEPTTLGQYIEEKLVHFQFEPIIGEQFVERFGFHFLLD